MSFENGSAITTVKNTKKETKKKKNPIFAMNNSEEAGLHLEVAN